ncbi:hypothetical protein BDV33DRAFT_211218 [Aspergillus novoparasiticus]|uniref:Uncharacterized protein n=1 Tax=Aspergillus novoparasiticus TaxID=986946 RepID=A0A5N6E6X2_9EURO|nr:hypothetical protein BDV33DRAFT_211218 [Aspergillus novoparasiticus]
MNLLYIFSLLQLCSFSLAAPGQSSSGLQDRHASMYRWRPILLYLGRMPELLSYYCRTEIDGAQGYCRF